MSPHKILTAFLLTVIFTACGTTAPENPPPTLPAIDTLVPTKTQEPTLTHLPTPINPTFTWTPLPTLSPEDAQAKVVELLETNGGCELPCFWGITPGVSTWGEAYNILFPFSQINMGEEVDGNRDIGIFILALKVMGLYPYQEYTARNGVIESISVSGLGDSPVTDIAYLLNSLGVPSEVWIRTYSHEEFESLPFGIALFYREKGIAVEYFVAGIEDGGSIKGCPGFGSYLHMALWRPTSHDDFLDIASRFYWFTEEEAFDYIPLEYATDLNPQSFYDEFINNQDACVKTPSNIWP